MSRWEVKRKGTIQQEFNAKSPSRQAQVAISGLECWATGGGEEGARIWVDRDWMGHIKPMSTTLRVPTAVFKSNMRPFVEKAKAGNSVIVTNDGEDDFRVLPIQHAGPPPVSEHPIAAELYRGLDVNAPAFEPWKTKALILKNGSSD